MTDADPSSAPPQEPPSPARSRCPTGRGRRAATGPRSPARGRRAVGRPAERARADARRSHDPGRDPRHEPRPVADESRHPRGRIGCDVGVEERRAERAGPTGRDEAEVRSLRVSVDRPASGPGVGSSSGSMSISASSSTWRGGAASVIDTTTPQTGRIGRHRPEGSTSDGLHGPAATTTSDAAMQVPSPSRAPTTRPASRSGAAPSAEADLDAARDRQVGVRPGRCGGLDRIADLQPAGGHVGPEGGLDRRVHDQVRGPVAPSPG